MTLIDLKRFLLFLGVWLILTSGDLEALAPGTMTAAGATFLAHRLVRRGDMQLRVLPLFALLPGFLWRSFLGGIDVARRAFDPRMPLNPGWVRYQTRLPPGASRVALGSELSLMPGTLAAGSDGDELLVHCLDTTADVDRMIAEEERRLTAATAVD
ncbi:MAG: Na+/H+ antiporter subunit E [Thermaurantiacus sp.]